MNLRGVEHRCVDSAEDEANTLENQLTGERDGVRPTQARSQRGASGVLATADREDRHSCSGLRDEAVHRLLFGHGDRTRPGNRPLCRHARPS
jgi:hypothetical protein